MAAQSFVPALSESLDQPPRLIVSDLDGTLLRSDLTISDRTRDVLARAEEAGATVVFATGRPTRWLAPVVEMTGRRGIAICSNGAVVYDLHEERVVETHPLAVEVGEAIVAAIGAALPEAAFGVELGHAFWHEATYPVSADYGDLRLVERAELFGATAAVKLLIRHRSYDSDALLAKAREIVGDLAEFTHSGSGGLLEISARGISKASTLALFCAERGIDASEVVAFGDMPNDLGMLAWAGRSYAVANAHPDVREAATGRCPSNDEDGVAATLERWFG